MAIHLLVASTNPGKIAEYQALLADLPLDIVGLADVGLDFEVDETGETFEENARIKAEAYAATSGLLTLADDSGLCVDALGGRPGVYSARYAPDSPARIRRLLNEMRDVPDSQRGAHFVCVIALAEPGAETVTFEGRCEGRIANAPSGANGFGFDPVFFMPDQGQTMAALPIPVKNRVSHRARATGRARRWLRRRAAQSINA